MKIKKHLKIFVGLLFVITVASLSVSLSVSQGKKTIQLRNVEALADWETEFEQASKVCTKAGGFCLLNGKSWQGIQLTFD